MPGYFFAVILDGLSKPFALTRAIPAPYLLCTCCALAVHSLCTYCAVIAQKIHSNSTDNAQRILCW
jgi:hypothetical protein